VIVAESAFDERGLADFELHVSFILGHVHDV